MGIVYDIIEDLRDRFTDKKSKYGFVTVGKYNEFTVDEKLEYHKYQGKSAVFLDKNGMVLTQVIKRQRDIELEGNQEFYMRYQQKLIKEICKNDRSFDWDEICYKLDDGNELVITAYSKGPLVHFTAGSALGDATIMGYDNVLVFESERYKDEILEVIDKLYKEASLH